MSEPARRILEIVGPDVSGLKALLRDARRLRILDAMPINRHTTLDMVARATGLHREQVHRDVKALRVLGHVIQAEPGKGVVRRRSPGASTTSD